MTNAIVADELEVGDALVVRSDTPRAYKSMGQGCMVLTFTVTASPVIRLQRDKGIYHWEVAQLVGGVWDHTSMVRIGVEAASDEAIAHEMGRSLPHAYIDLCMKVARGYNPGEEKQKVLEEFVVHY